jgi:hypothetical protein
MEVTVGAGATLDRWRDGGDTARAQACVGAGAMLYAVYAVCVGGDFMAGRFFSVPIFVFALVGFYFGFLPPQTGIEVAPVAQIVANRHINLI